MTRPTDPAPTADHWSDWVLTKRHGGDSAHEQLVRGRLAQICDRVLHGANLTAGDSLLDLGCGDGLIGFGAFERVPALRKVIFLDVSPALVAHVERTAAERGLADRCDFVTASAERLSAIADASVEAATSRAVLAYLKDKPAAIRELSRVLQPGGRVSIAEPILRDQSLQFSRQIKGLSLLPQNEATDYLALVMRWKSAQFPTTPEGITQNPLTEFSEWDLVRHFQDAGFRQIHLELHIDVRPTPAMPWDTFLDIAPHPWAPTLRAILTSDFTTEEAERLEAVLRPSVESGGEQERDAIAYLTAIK